jgi:glycosyltransferase involved in cell wall biosynthesis
VGDGPERKKLETLANKIRAPVNFVGKISRKKLIKLYQECSFFVSASRWEGFGLIFLEANACGKPVIGYNLTAIKERIKNGFNGFLVENFEELVSKSKILASNKNLRRIMGKKAYFISKKFNWSRIVISYDKCFKKI